ncbi:MAG: ABC transporter substrate-binding protein [Spirochaetales bacterium]|nr:ABC transporter substrate-binding protein [Spirochaetales bacterium]
MLKKILSILLVLTMVSTAVFANGASDEKPMTEDGKVKVTMWTISTGQELEIMQELAQTYNGEHPEVSVEVVQVVGSETDTSKLMAAVVGGVGPDIYFLDRFTVAQRASEGVLMDLTPLVEDRAYLEDNYMPAAWREVVYEGEIYALPFDTDARMIYYNKDLIREAGFDPAEFDMANGPMDIDRFKEIAMALNVTDESGAYTQIGFSPFVDQGWHYTWGYVHDADFYDEKAHQMTLTEDKGVMEGFQFMYDWAKSMDPQKLATWKSTYYPQDMSPANHPFVTKKCAMVCSGPWRMDTINRYGSDIDYGVTYLPTPDKSVKSWAGGWCVVIPEGSKVPEEAFAFMNYFAGEPGQTKYMNEGNHLVTWMPSMENGDFSGSNAHLAPFKALLAEADSRPPLAIGAFIWDQLTVAQDKMALNESTPAEALAEAQELINQRLN